MMKGLQVNKATRAMRKKARQAAAASIGWRALLIFLYVTAPFWVLIVVVIKTRAWRYFSIKDLRAALHDQKICDHEGQTYSAFRLLLFPRLPPPLPKAEFRHMPEAVEYESSEGW